MEHTEQEIFIIGSVTSGGLCQIIKQPLQICHHCSHPLRSKGFCGLYCSFCNHICIVYPSRFSFAERQLQVALCLENAGGEGEEGFQEWSKTKLGTTYFSTVSSMCSLGELTECNPREPGHNTCPLTCTLLLRSDLGHVQHCASKHWFGQETVWLLFRVWPRAHNWWVCQSFANRYR